LGYLNDFFSLKRRGGAYWEVVVVISDVSVVYYWWSDFKFWDGFYTEIKLLVLVLRSTCFRSILKRARCSRLWRSLERLLDQHGRWAVV